MLLTRLENDTEIVLLDQKGPSSKVTIGVCMLKSQCKALWSVLIVK